MRRPTGFAGGMPNRRRLLQLAVLSPLVAMVGPGAAGAQGGGARSFSTRVVQSGHSLTDPIVPVLWAMVAAAGGAGAAQSVIDLSTIPGSPMDWRWNHRNQYMRDARDDIADYDLLVITERAPLSGTFDGHNSPEEALRWFNHANSKGSDGAGAESILYATWVHTDSGPGSVHDQNDPEGHLTFRERLPLEMARWQAIADHVNDHRPEGSQPMQVIPGPLIMAAVHDAIEAGAAPGLSRIEDLFSDTIHLNAQGAYLISLAHFAVIYGQDPRALTRGMGRLETPPAETATWMRQVVHDVLAGYGSAGYPHGG